MATVAAVATVATVAFLVDLEELISEALGDEGYQVHALPLRGDTVSVLGKIRLDAVLIDGYPYTNLPTILKALRDQEVTRALPAVVVTSKQRKDLDAFAPVEHVEMPFDLAEFLAAIRRAVAASPRRA